MIATPISFDTEFLLYGEEWRTNNARTGVHVEGKLSVSRVGELQMWVGDPNNRSNGDWFAAFPANVEDVREALVESLKGNYKYIPLEI